jgi:hypothetical protein
VRKSKQAEDEATEAWMLEEAKQRLKTKHGAPVRETGASADAAQED